MLTITLPNKDKKKYEKPITSAQIASEISQGLPLRHLYHW